MSSKNELEHIREITKEQFLAHIGETIRRYRKINSIPRDVLAAHLGCDSSTLSRYELGRSDIKASTMAYASIACNFPMSKYTEIYDKNPAAVVDDFKTLVYISTPRRKKTDKTKDSNLPPKPNLKFDKNTWQWIMVKQLPEESPVLHEEPVSEPVSDSFFMEYMSNPSSDTKRILISQISELVRVETENGQRKCSKELKSLARATIKYVITCGGNKRQEQRLMLYARHIQNLAQL